MDSKEAAMASHDQYHDQHDDQPPPPYEAIPQDLSEAQGISVNGTLCQLITLF